VMPAGNSTNRLRATEPTIWGDGANLETWGVARGGGCGLPLGNDRNTALGRAMKTANHYSSRRQFLARAQHGIGLGIAGGFTAPGEARPQESAASNSLDQRLPREVWVASIGQMGLSAQTSGEMCRKMLNRMEEVLSMQPDIICTPEVFPFVGLPGNARQPLQEIAEERTGPVLDQFSERQERCLRTRHDCKMQSGRPQGPRAAR